MVNDSKFGLSAAVYTEDPNAAEEIARKVNSLI